VCARAERETGTGKYVRKGSGTRTIYLYTIDWTVCSHYEEKVEEVVRGCESEGRGRGECGDVCVSLSFEPAVAEGCCGKKRRSGDGRTEINGKNEENTEAAIWRSTGVRGGDNKGTEIEWRPSRGVSPCDPAESLPRVWL
jgi:hypothetical protein